jgi:hypothetical protein
VKGCAECFGYPKEEQEHYDGVDSIDANPTDAHWSFLAFRALKRREGAG